jgi:hypothetical protein
MRQWKVSRKWIIAESRALHDYRVPRTAEKEHRGRGDLLSGAALAHALDWLQSGLSDEPPPQGKASPPSAAWATRDVRAAPDGVYHGFALVRSYIERSADVVQAQKGRARNTRLALQGLAVAVFLAGLAGAWFGVKAYRASLAVTASTLWHSLSSISSTEKSP